MNTEYTVVCSLKEVPSELEAESIPEEQLAQVHSFSRKLAREYGTTAAIILGYLADRIQAVEEKRQDRLGYFTSINQLAKRYPYLSAGTIAGTLVMLRKEGVLKAENHNKYKYDRTLWYTFANAQVQKDAAWDPIRFKVADAVKYGVVEAVLLANLRYWINENRKEKPDYTWHRISSRTLAKHLPFDYRTLARALGNLVKLGAVERQQCHGFDHAFNYRVLQEAHLDGSNLEMDGSKPEIDGSKLELDGAKVEMHGSKPEIDGSNPYDDTILIDSVEKTSLGNPHCEERVGKNTFITPAAAPSGSCVCFNTPTPPDETEEKAVTKPHHLPIPAEGVHSQVGVLVTEAVQETKSVSSSAGVSSSEPVPKARDLIKPPAGYVPSAKSSRLSLGSAKALGSGHNKTGSVLTSSVVAVSSSATSSSSVAGSNHIPSVQGVVAPSSSSSPAQSTGKMIDAKVVFPFAAVPPTMSSGLTPEQAKEKVAHFRRAKELQEQAEVQHLKLVKELEERRWAMYEDLTKRYGSPYAAQENVKALSPEEKVKVLKAGLRSRLKTGLWCEGQNERYCCTPIFTKKGLEMARRFFEFNPGVTAFDLLQMVDLCCEIDHDNPNLEGGYDEFFYQRRGTNLSFLLKHLPTINAKLNLLLLPPDVVYLDDIDSGPQEDQQERVEGLEEEISTCRDIQHQADQPPTTLPSLPYTSTALYPKPVPCQANRADESKCIITVKNPAPWQQQPRSTMAAVNNSPPPDTYQAALVELGKILLKNEDQTPWMSLRKISGQCIKHWATLPRLNYSIRYLSDWASDFFPRSGEIRGHQVKVTYKTEPSHSKRPPDLYIQFVKVYPNGTCN